ncbi:MAG: hypothetical protein OXD49_01755 [Candidatus Poribacteria bacterium]|nr:hypothetical protein [Candidatus Poribacteria bacterium]
MDIFKEFLENVIILLRIIAWIGLALFFIGCWNILGVIVGKKWLEERQGGLR